MEGENHALLDRGGPWWDRGFRYDGFTEGFMSWRRDCEVVREAGKGGS